jgi:argininosuccinate lyase
VPDQHSDGLRGAAHVVACATGRLPDPVVFSMTFSPDYVRLVLRENFDDARRLLLDPLLAVHEAHLVMLAEQGIVSRDDARVIRDGLAGLDVEALRQAPFDGSVEDLFFHVDRLLARASGAEPAGRLHTARSRNDIDMTMYRMRLREYLLVLTDQVLALRQRLLALARRHTHTVFPAHTHTQPAQPTTVAHYLLGVIEQAERDTGRLAAAYATTNRNPLGSCAITGTAFPIDRNRTSALLGFDGPTGNTYGSIATVDYVLEGAGAVAVLLTGLGRFVQDLLLWCTVEVGYLRLPDGFVQGSSIMPQKRNPVALEHARALTSKALASATSLPVIVHNTPFGDIVDTEDDLQPAIASMYADATRAVNLTAAALEHAEFNVERMRTRAGENWVTATELADSLVRDHGLSFGQAHAIVAGLVRRQTAAPDVDASTHLQEASAEVMGAALTLSTADLARLLDPDHFVRARRTPGGPAPDVTEAALAESTVRLDRDRAAVDERRASLRSADADRRRALQKL